MAPSRLEMKKLPYLWKLELMGYLAHEKCEAQAKGRIVAVDTNCSRNRTALLNLILESTWNMPRHHTSIRSWFPGTELSTV